MQCKQIYLSEDQKSYIIFLTETDESAFSDSEDEDIQAGGR